MLSFKTWGRTSLVIQWLRHRASNARGTGSIPGHGSSTCHGMQSKKFPKVLKPGDKGTHSQGNQLRDKLLGNWGPQAMREVQSRSQCGFHLWGERAEPQLGGVCDQRPVSREHVYFRRTPSVSAEVLSAAQVPSPEAGCGRPPKASVLCLCLQGQWVGHSAWGWILVTTILIALIFIQIYPSRYIEVQVSEESFHPLPVPLNTFRIHMPTVSCKLFQIAICYFGNFFHLLSLH